jgi:hypothetical protein
VKGIGRSLISAKAITSIFPGGRKKISKCPSTGYPISRYGVLPQGVQRFVIKLLKEKAQSLQCHTDVRCLDRGRVSSQVR